MSIDIYFMFQSRQASGWEDIRCEHNGYHGGCDPALLAWLGLGGGDEKHSYAIVPLAAPRGFPQDFPIVDTVFHPLKDIHVLPREKRGYFQRRDLRVLMGQADFSHYLAYEILKADPPKATRTMAMPIENYHGWDRQGVPGTAVPVPRDWRQHPAYVGQFYSAPDGIDAATRFVVFDVEYDFDRETAWFRELLVRLSGQYGEIRIVFGFA